MKSILLLLHLATLLPLATSNCWCPNGEDRNAARGGTPLNGPDAAYQPLNPNVTVSMCCATSNVGANHVNSSYDAGLCVDSNGQMWRESCTDRSWQDPACIHLCVDGVDPYGAPNNATDLMITPCPDGSYCCGMNNTACCDAGGGYFIRSGQAVPVHPTSNSVSSPPTATLQTPRPSPQHHGLSGGAIAGIVVGIVAAVALVLLVVFMLLRRRRVKTAEQSALVKSSDKEVVPEQHGELDGSNPLQENDAASVHEMPDPDYQRKQEELKKENAQEKG